MTTIITKNSSTASAVPVSGDLTQGELAVNVTDKKLYTKNSGGSVVKIVGSLGNQEASSVTLSGGSINGTTVGAVTPSTGAFTTLSASSTVSGTGFSTYLASPPAIGGTAAAAGSFTTLSASSTVTLSGGTANGVLYLNGSKVATSGSALTFDGTNVGIGTSNNNVFDQVGAARPLVVQKSDTSTTIAGSTASITISNSDTTTNNTAQLNFAAITGANTNQYSSAIISAIFGARTNGQYPTGQLVFSTSTSLNAAPTEKMRIDSSGNVGIGTSSPSYNLHVRGATGGITNSTDPQWWVKRDSGAEILFQPTSSLGYLGTYSNHPVSFIQNNTERMRINSSGNVGIGTSPNKRLTVYSDDGYIQMLNASTGTGNTDGSFIGVEGGTTALRIVNQENDVISFHTNGLANERMRIDPSGYLLINQTSNVTSSYLQIKGAQPAISCESTSTGSVSQVLFRNPNGQVGSIGTSGTSTSYNTSSDYRLKENIAPMTGALAKVAALNPVTYTWKVDGFAGQGFIAHELQAVVPDCVTGEKDAIDEEGKPQYQGIDTSFLVATLTAAIKEQQALIEQLTTRIAALEAK